MKTISDFGFQNAGTKEHFIVQGQKSIIEHRSNNRVMSSFKSAISLRNSMEFQGPKSRKSFRFLGGNPQSPKSPHTPSFRSHRATIRSGFTLIELMVVIAIIGILASIMIPNVVRHLEKGKEARAIADIDILIKAVSLFQIDNGGPPGDLGELWDTGVGGPYISSDEGESLDTPWDGTYVITSGTGSYTIATTDIGNEGEPKVSKTIKFE